MALASVEYTGNGVTKTFVVSFNYLEEDHITVTLDDVVTTAYTWTDSTNIEFTTAPANGVVINISRDSDITQKIVEYADGSNLTEEDLNNQSDQSLFLQQETRDLIDTINGDNSIVVDRVDALETDSHTHSNKSILDNIEEAYTTVEKSKLAGIEASADVTDVTNVTAAGAVMSSSVVDEDDMVSDSDVLVPTQQSVKAYADTKAVQGDINSSISTERGTVATLTNKTFDDEIAMKELSSTPSNPDSGYKFIYPKDDGKVYTLDAAGNEKEVGSGGGGGLDTVHTETFDDTINAASFTTGNNATYDNGGTLDGTLSDDSVTNISGDKSLKYVMGSTSTNDFIKSPTIAMDSKQQGSTLGMTFYYTYDGADDDIKVVVYDDTNSQILTSSVVYIKASSVPKRFSVQFPVNTDTADITYGFQVVTGNSGKILVIDDVEISSNPFVSKEMLDTPVVVKGAGNGGTALTASVTDIDFTETEDDLGVWDGNSFTAPSDGDYIVSGNVRLSAGSDIQVQAFIDGTLAYPLGGNVGSVLSHNFGGTVKLLAGEVLSLRSNVSVNLVNSTVLHTLSIVKVPEASDHIIAYNSRNAENSMVRLHTGNGHGSTNTKIRRFSTEVVNIGNAITYADSATDGASFTIEEDGVYNIAYSDIFTTAAGFGLSLNSSQLTTDIISITASDRLIAEETSANGFLNSTSWSGNLSKGDVIRPHTSGVTQGIAARTTFTIAKIGVGDLMGIPTHLIREDKYTSEETYVGTFDGERLYERSYTVPSDVTTTSTLTTWASGLKPKGIVNYVTTEWSLFTFAGTGVSPDYVDLYYDSSDGGIKAVISGVSYKIGEGTTIKMQYTK